MGSQKNGKISEQKELPNHSAESSQQSLQGNDYTVIASGDTDTTGLRTRNVQTRLSSGEWAWALAGAGLRGCTSFAEFMRLLIREEAGRLNLGPMATTPEARQKMLLKLLTRDEQRPKEN